MVKSVSTDVPNPNATDVEKLGNGYKDNFLSKDGPVITTTKAQPMDQGDGALILPESWKSIMAWCALNAFVSACRDYLEVEMQLISTGSRTGWWPEYIRTTATGLVTLVIFNLIGFAGLWPKSWR